MRFQGVIPANLLPFKADLSIDEAAYRRHLSWLAGTKGVTGITVNGHAAEVSSLSREERVRALAIAADEVGGKVPLIAGIYADGSSSSSTRRPRGSGILPTPSPSWPSSPRSRR